MNKNTITWLLIYGVVGYGAYYYLTRKKRNAKAIIISGNYSLGIDKLMMFGNDFLTPWAKSAKSGMENFMYNGLAYKTKGGRRA